MAEDLRVESNSWAEVGKGSFNPIPLGLSMPILVRSSSVFICVHLWFQEVR